MSIGEDLQSVQQHYGVTRAERVLGVGIIGCGWISDVVHMPNLEAHPDVRVTAFADRSPERRHLAARRFPNARSYDAVERLYTDPDVQAVVIAVPPAANRHVATAAFAAGKHVYLEKPLAPSLVDANAIVDAWQRSGCIAMLGYNFRFNPGIENAISIIRSNGLGKLLSVQSRFTWLAEAVESWRGDRALGGGVLLDLASHHIDLFHAVGSTRLTCVHARERSVLRAGDTIDMTMQDDLGTIFQLHASLAGGANTNHCTFLCERGQLEVDLRDGRPRPPLRGDQHIGRLERLRRGLSELHPSRIMAPPGRERSYARALDIFVGSCRHGIQPQPGLEHGLEVLRVIDAARQCAKTTEASREASLPPEQGLPQSGS